MSGLYEKSLNKLELNSVLELLAGEAVSGAAKEVCREIKPESDVEEVRRLLEQTSAACRLISLKGSPSLGGIRDVGEPLDRADRGGVLSPGELLRIAASLRVARAVKNYADTDAVSSCLDYYFWDLTVNKYPTRSSPRRRLQTAPARSCLTSAVTSGSRAVKSANRCKR